MRIAQVEQTVNKHMAEAGVELKKYTDRGMTFEQIAVVDPFLMGRVYALTMLVLDLEGQP